MLAAGDMASWLPCMHRLKVRRQLACLVSTRVQSSHHNHVFNRSVRRSTALVTIIKLEHHGGRMSTAGENRVGLVLPNQDVVAIRKLPHCPDIPRTVGRLSLLYKQN
jgi:hypothetical protein